MPYTDLLRITVFLTAAEATALGAITAIAAGRDGDTTTLLVAAAWWLVALAIGLYLGRPAARRRRRPRRPRPRPHRHLAARREPRPGSPSAASGRSALTAIAAGVLGIFFPGVAAIGAGYALLVSLAWHTREAAVLGVEQRDGVKFYVVPNSRPAPDRAGPHAGPAQRPPRGRDVASAQPACSSFLNSRPAAGVGDVGGGQPGAAGGGDGVGHVVEGVDAVGVGVEDDRDAGFGGEAGVVLGEVAAVGVAVDLEHRAGAGGGLGDRLDVDPVGLAAADQAAGEVADAVDVRVLDRGEDALGHLLFGDREGGVDAGDDPVERGDEVVGVVERAVEADVDLRAGEQAEAALALVPGARPPRSAPRAARR